MPSAKAKSSSRKSSAAPQTCYRCGQSAIGGYKLKQGHICRACNTALVDERIVASKQDGTFGAASAWLVVCAKCRQWVSGIFHVTLDHKPICVRCAAAMGDEDARRIVGAGVTP